MMIAPPTPASGTTKYVKVLDRITIVSHKEIMAAAFVIKKFRARKESDEVVEEYLYSDD
jgi:hypothetical protein